MRLAGDADVLAWMVIAVHSEAVADIKAQVALFCPVRGNTLNIGGEVFTTSGGEGGLPQAQASIGV